MSPEDPSVREIRRVQDRIREVSQARIGVNPYLDVLHFFYDQFGLDPRSPYTVVKDRSGRIMRLEPTPISIHILEAGRIDWVETSYVTRDGRVRFPQYDYHFQPRGNRLHSFRVERDPEDTEGHVNPSPSLQTELGNHLRFSEGGTKVEVMCFNLLLVTAVAVQYALTGEYPFSSGSEDKYNGRLTILRKRVELR